MVRLSFPKICTWNFSCNDVFHIQGKISIYEYVANSTTRNIFLVYSCTKYNHSDINVGVLNAMYHTNQFFLALSYFGNFRL